MRPAKKPTRVNPKAAGDLDRTVGQTIRRLRLQTGMSQSALGAAANVTFQQLQKYESGTNRLSVARLVQLAHALQVPLVALLEGLPNVPAAPRIAAPVVNPAVGKRAAAG